MTTDDIIRMATLAGARPGFDNQADLSFLQDFAALVADAATAPLHARIAELEAMLDAIGAGGVGQSIKPQVRDDAAQEPGAGIPASVPTGWKLVPMEPTAAMLDAAFDTEVVHMEWGVDAFVENTAEVYGAMLAAAPEAPAQQKPVAHLPCCGYADTSALKWNPYNSVAQCHNCGQVYAAPPPPAAQQEPVAWMYEWNGRTHITTADQRPIEHAHPHFKKSKPLYAAPQPARQPLTNEQIIAIADSARAAESGDAGYILPIAFARAIEAAYGIT